MLSLFSLQSISQVKASSSPNHVGSSPNHVAAATEKSGQDEEHDRDASASNRAVMAIALRDMLHSRDLRAFDDATRVEKRWSCS